MLQPLECSHYTCVLASAVTAFRVLRVFTRLKWYSVQQALGLLLTSYASLKLHRVKSCLSELLSKPHCVEVSLPWAPVLKSGSLVFPEHEHTAVITSPQQLSITPFASPEGFRYSFKVSSYNPPSPILLPMGPVAQVQPRLQLCLQMHPTHPTSYAS